MKRKRRPRLVFYIVYVLVLLIGMYVVYKMIPPHILEELQRAYFSGGGIDPLD